MNTAHCEFDWCDIKLTIGRAKRRLYMALFSMCKSNYRFGMIFHRHDTLAFTEAHIAFFDAIGVVPLRMNYDNMRIAIAEFVGLHEKKATVAFLQLSTFFTVFHIGFIIFFAATKRAMWNGVSSMPAAKPLPEKTCLTRLSQRKTGTGKTHLAIGLGIKAC